MVDVSTMIAAKSDQLNADDLFENPRTITVTAVKATGDKEQPLAISYQGDGGKPYKPGKSMRRVLVQLWGKEGSAYVGRSMTIYRDGEVTFGKLKVGGIRISHMTDIGTDQILALAVTKGAKRAYEVKPLRIAQQNGEASNPREEQVEAYIAAINNPEVVSDIDAFREYQLDERRAKWIAGIKDKYPALGERIVEANSKRLAELADVADVIEPSSDDADVERDSEGGDQRGTTGEVDDGDDEFPS